MTDHVIPMNQESMVASLAIQILTIPVPPEFSPDAIAGHAGMGEPWRIRYPVVEYESNVSARFLLIAGLNPKEKCHERLTLERLTRTPYNLRKTEGVFVQPSALNTKDQTNWIINRVNEFQISKLLFLSSPYHIVRAYLTLIKSWLQIGTQPVVMIPKPLIISSSVILPENGEPARAMIPGEIHRILEYQKKGDVATLAEFETYLDQII